jgi:hypothetical protein
MSLYSSFSVCLSAARIQSEKNGATCWPAFKGFCLNQNCRRYLQAEDGIFCANYFARRGPFAPCLSSYCGPCYTTLGIRRFPIRQKVDDDGGVIEDDNDDIRFKCARAGDHLMIPFQCETCHFRNIMQRDPDPNSCTDTEMLDLMRQANLDAFWSREISTVKSNLREGIRMEKMSKRFGMPCITPVMGPWPLEDNLGMKVAMALLDRSLDQGKYEETVQWDTF